MSIYCKISKGLQYFAILLEPPHDSNTSTNMVSMEEMKLVIVRVCNWFTRSLRGMLQNELNKYDS